MTRSSATGIIFISLLLLSIRVCDAQEAGVLLGLQSKASLSQALPYYAGDTDSLARTVYHTLLITKRDSVYTVHGETEDLLLPRGDGFWRIGIKRSVYNNWVEDFVWAGPEGATRRLTGIQPYNGEFCEGHRQQRILYASPKYLSLEQRSAGYCEGAVHPWFFNTLAVVPIDSTSHQGLTITDVLGPAAYENLEASIHTFVSTLEDEEGRAAYIDEPDPANWGLLRQEGAWTVIGRLENAEEVSQGTYIDLPLDVAVTDSLTGATPLAFTWTSIQNRFPGAVDAFVAPQKDWLLLVHTDRLTVHALNDEEIGPATTIRPLAPDTRTVFVQWAVDSRLHRWIRHFDNMAGTLHHVKDNDSD